jgi:putative ATPase
VAEPVPLHLRNAPTRLMKELEYGRGYRYAHDEAAGVAADMVCLPPAHAGRRFYEPTERGLESEIKRKLDELRRQRATPADDDEPGG